MAHKDWIELHVAESMRWKDADEDGNGTYHIHRHLLRGVVIEDRGHFRYFTVHHQAITVDETVEELIALAEGK